MCEKKKKLLSSNDFCPLALVTHSSLAFLLIILGAKVFCKIKECIYEIGIATSYYTLKHLTENSEHFRTFNAEIGISGACCSLAFFTPPKVRSLERIEGRRPGEIAAGGRRLGNGTRGFPPGVGTRRPLASPDPESAILN